MVSCCSFFICTYCGCCGPQSLTPGHAELQYVQQGVSVDRACSLVVDAWSAGRLVGWLAGWLVGWFGWFIAQASSTIEASNTICTFGVISCVTYANMGLEQEGIRNKTTFLLALGTAVLATTKRLFQFIPLAPPPQRICLLPILHGCASQPDRVQSTRDWGRHSLR